MKAWHQYASADTVLELRSDVENGLPADEVVLRQEEYGANELVESGGRGAGRILWEQFRSAMILLLAAAALVSLWLHEFVDAGAIVGIVAINAALGFFQDYRAEKALAALRRLAVPSVKVRRDRQLQEISAKELVPGDILVLETGNLIPADCRLLETANLRIDESSLTGESEAVEKQVEPLDVREPSLGDRTNMAYMGTLAAYGHGLAIVTDIGMATELGRIAHSLRTVKSEPTPLQRRLAQLGRTLALVALLIVAIVFALGMLQGEDTKLMLMTALSLAVAIVPEGLPAVATVALALGAGRMFQRQALIRKLPAVETLGSVTVICSDKTGTLTENRMTVTVLDVAGRRIDFTKTSQDEVVASEPDHAQPFEDGSIVGNSSLSLLLAGASLCNDAQLLAGDDPSDLHALGEPTEAALVVAAAHLGLAQEALVNRFPRIGEVPFDSQRKKMTTVHRVKGTFGTADVREKPCIGAIGRCLGDAEHVAFMKGAVDAVLRDCRFALMNDQALPLDENVTDRIDFAHDHLAGSGMRVLGVAFRTLGEETADGVEHDMVFVGMLGMIDPPRPEAHEAVARCRAAGIRPIMITGDHPLTAQHIAGQLGFPTHKQVLAGQKLAQMSVDELEQAASDVSVYARVAPTDKLRIVQALQTKREVVAMTGDGVNDAPALKQAHIGVAMGRIGTDVAKEAADMVLMDDNFATIVNAVEEGRIVYDNIRKFVRYTMTSNAGEVWVMLLGPILGMPLPLVPLQILWINLVTDGLPGLALAVEPAERNTMRRPPYAPDEHIMGRGMWRAIAWVGLLMGTVSVAAGYWQWDGGTGDEAHWRTIVFTVLTLSQMGNALAIRSANDSLFRVGLLSNKAMLGSVLLTCVLQLTVIYWAPLQAVFRTTALSVGELALCLLLSTVVFWAIEAEKLWSRHTGSETDRI